MLKKDFIKDISATLGIETIYVDIDNIAKWYYQDVDRGIDSLDEFPCLLSPWNSAIYHFFFPAHMWKGDIEVNRWLAGIPVRAHVTTSEFQDDEDRQGLEKYCRDNNHDFFVDREVYFLDYIEVFLGNNPEPIIGVFILLNKDGTCSSNRTIIAEPHDESPFDEHELKIIAGSAIFPVATAISFLNCKNVEVRDRPLSRQQRRMKERGKPVITYKELVIDAFRDRVRYEAAEAGQNPIHRALHICRGHFATYTEDAPLFGRVTGTFWIPQHVRGSKKYGEVHKTYTLKT